MGACVGLVQSGIGSKGVGRRYNETRWEQAKMYKHSSDLDETSGEGWGGGEHEA